MARRVYWDSCAWLAYLNREVGRAVDCDAVLNAAIKREVDIATSTIAHVEVFKMKADGAVTATLSDEEVDALFDQEWVLAVQVSRNVTSRARALMRQFPQLKPYDATHLASALEAKAVEFHTFDGRLLELDGQVKRDDLSAIRICVPYMEKASAPLFDHADAKAAAAVASAQEGGSPPGAAASAQEGGSPPGAAASAQEGGPPPGAAASASGRPA